MEENSGCKQCKTWEEEMYWKHFNCMHFFQFLRKDFHDHLVLPAKFAENMTAKLPDKVSLIGPSGTVWDVELLKIDNLVFAGDGWKNFVKAYNLEENCLLLFKYKQNTGFEVLIFDRDGLCEKEASYFVKKCSHSKPDHIINHKKRAVPVSEASSTEVMEDNDEDDDGSEFVVSKKSRVDVAKQVVCLGRRNKPRSTRKYPAATRGGVKPRRVVAQPKSLSKPKANYEKKPTEKDSAKEPNQSPEGELITPETEERNLTTPENGVIPREVNQSVRSSGMNRGRPVKRVLPKSSKKLVFKSVEKRPSKEYMSNRRPVTEMEKEDALRRAKLELTDTSFIAVMRPTCVYRRFYLTIPSEWMNKHFPPRNKQVVLRVGEKTWFTMFYCNGRKGGGISPGWKNFALENFLEEFDVCLFKLASEKGAATIVLDVNIFRVIPEVIPTSPVVSSLLT